jgi:hypothetical protein
MAVAETLIFKAKVDPNARSDKGIAPVHLVARSHFLDQKILSWLVSCNQKLKADGAKLFNFHVVSPPDIGFISPLQLAV